MRAEAKTSVTASGKQGAKVFGVPRPAAVAAAAIAATLAIGAALWWWWMQPQREGVRLHAGAQAFPWSRAPQVLEPTAPASAQSAPSSAVEPAQGRPEQTGPVAFDLCGIGRIVIAGRAAGRLGGEGGEVGAGGERGALAELPAPVGRFPLQEAQARLVQALGAGDAKQRVASRLLQDPPEAEPATQAVWAGGLLADALASRDAQALRWAGTACPFVEDETACRQRLARARVQAEPANALHWLEWAHEEPAAADAAWAGLTRAQYWRESPLALAGVLLRAVPTDIPGYLQSTLAVDAMARDVAFPGPPLALALERCAPRPGGTATAGECERLARLLVERSDSVQALMLGRELGEHIGWPAQQLQRLEQEVEVLQKQEHRWAVDERRPLGCETVEGQRSHIADVERVGELAALRRNLPAGANAAPGRRP